MTKEEINHLVSTGSEIKRTFYTRSMSHDIDGNKITQTQYDGVIKRFEGKLTLEIIGGGFTKHISKLKDIYL